MSEKYKIREKDKAYFVTLTVVDWVDVFTKKQYKLLLIDSLKYCQHYKGLEIYGWCLMSNHMHMIAKAIGEQTLSEILRDFKKFTSKTIVKSIIELPDSRSKWMISRFAYAGKYLKRIENYKFWQDGNHAEIIYSPFFFYEKLNYIHNNPVKEMIVCKPEEYYFSSARNYAGLESLLDIVIETPQLRTY
ncbi:MAG: transposase [Bacteroidota bacterium]